MVRAGARSRRFDVSQTMVVVLRAGPATGRIAARFPTRVSATSSSPSGRACSPPLRENESTDSSGSYNTQASRGSAAARNQTARSPRCEANFAWSLRVLNYVRGPEAFTAPGCRAQR